MSLVFKETPVWSPCSGDPAVCTQSSASLSLAICLLESKGVDYTSLHLKDQRCRGRVNAKSHMVTFGFSLNNTCGTEATVSPSLVSSRQISVCFF